MTSPAEIKKTLPSSENQENVDVMAGGVEVNPDEVKKSEDVVEKKIGEEKLRKVVAVASEAVVERRQLSPHTGNVNQVRMKHI